MSQQNDEGQSEETPSGLRAEIERQVERAKQAEAERDQLLNQYAELARDRVFDKAGVPEQGAGKYFRQAWKPGEGQELSVETVQQAAMEEGIIPFQGSQAQQQAPAQQQPQQPDPAETIAAQQAIAGMVQSSGQAATQPTPAADQLRQAGQYGEGSKDEVMARFRELGLPPDADSIGDDKRGW